MNRKDRRAKQQADRKDRRKRWPSGYVDTSGTLEPGTRFTIAGVRRLQDGRIDYNCPQGEETVFVAGPGVAASRDRLAAR